MKAITLSRSACRAITGRLSRRDFLGNTLLAGAGWLAATVSARGSAAEKPAPGSKMRFGLTSYEWGRDWDILTMIANCQKAGAWGVELRTNLKYAHGVELEISAARRGEVRKQFADSPVRLIGIASGERFDSPNPQEVAAAIEKSKGYVKLSHDLGSTGVRVFPNDFHKDVPRERTIAQIAKALNVVGAFAAEYGQQVRLEAHGSAGELPTLRAIMDQVTQRAVRLKLNSDKRDATGKGFEHQFGLIKDFLGDTLHAHDFRATDFPNQLQIDLLVKMGWSGWVLLESSDKVPDRVQGLREQRELWEKMFASSVRRLAS
jgi:hypothetical protein